MRLPASAPTPLTPTQPARLLPPRDPRHRRASPLLSPSPHPRTNPRRSRSSPPARPARATSTRPPSCRSRACPSSPCPSSSARSSRRGPCASPLLFLWVQVPVLVRVNSKADAAQPRRRARRAGHRLRPRPLLEPRRHQPRPRGRHGPLRRAHTRRRARMGRCPPQVRHVAPPPPSSPPTHRHFSVVHPRPHLYSILYPPKTRRGAPCLSACLLACYYCICTISHLISFYRIIPHRTPIPHRHTTPHTAYHTHTITAIPPALRCSVSVAVYSI